MTSPTFGFQNSILNSFVESIGCHRLGLKLDAGVFSVAGANGEDLSNLNLGFVTIPRRGSPALLKTYFINANQSFNDSSSGSSTIIGNLFGTTSGDIWSEDVPFYLYACIDDANSTPIMGISRIPNLVKAPIVAHIGTPSSPTADVSYGIFLFSDVTIANYDLNPVVCLGCFRMQKITGNDWTVQAFDPSDGVGRFFEDTNFIYPAGVNGNASGAFFSDNGGTAPTFSANVVNYKISRDGMIWEGGLCSNLVAPGTAGSGAVTLTHFLPIEFDNTVFSIGSGSYQNTPGNPFNNMAPISTGTNITYRLNNGTTASLANNSFNGTAGYGVYWDISIPVRTE